MRKPEAGLECLFAVRSLTPEDAGAFVHFASSVSEGERRFLKENLDALEE